MSRPGSIERLAALAALLCVVAGCALPGRSVEPAAVDALPPALTARYDAAVARFTAGESAAAAEEFRALAAAYPGHAGPLLNLALIESRAGRDAEAMALLEAAAAVCTQCGAIWNERGVLDRRAGRFTAAETAYRRAIEVEPGYALAYYNLAVLYELYLQRPDLALDNYRRYLEATPEPARMASVNQWVTDLERRAAVAATAARGKEGT
jgi:tetratricopeptide (TPR) repeat protein